MKRCDIGFIFWCRSHTVINPFKNYSGDKFCYAFLGDVQDFKYYETPLEALAGLSP